MSFTDLCNEIKEKVFSRFKEENVSIEDTESDIVWKESGKKMNEICIIDVENYLYDFGFYKALEIYDLEVGLDSLTDMHKLRRVKCLLQYAIRDSLYDLEESYKEWCEENKDEGEGEGQIEGEETTN